MIKTGRPTFRAFISALLRGRLHRANYKRQNTHDITKMHARATHRVEKEKSIFIIFLNFLLGGRGKLIPGVKESGGGGRSV